MTREDREGETTQRGARERDNGYFPSKILTAFTVRSFLNYRALEKKYRSVKQSIIITAKNYRTQRIPQYFFYRATEEPIAEYSIVFSDYPHLQ